MARSIALTQKYKADLALPAVLRAYRIYGAAGEPRSQALALLNLGSIYLTARDYQQALRYYSDAIARYPGDPALLMGAFANRGQVFLQMGNGRLAAAEYLKAISRAEALHSALRQQRYLGSLAYSEILANDSRAAADAILRARTLTASTSPEEQRTSIDWVSAALALQQGDIAEAKRLITGVFAGVDLATTSLAQRDPLHTAYEIYKAAGDEPRALTYLEAFKQADDKARSIAASASAALMSARFDFVNQQAQIKQLHATQVVQAAAARAKLRSTVLKGVLFAGSVVFALLLFGYFSIRRSRDQVRAANADLSASNSALQKALAARTEFLAMTSHEIRTPLNGILGMTQVLLADRAIAAPVRGKIELVHGAGETMKALVDDLLDVAKMTTGEVGIQRAEMDLAQLLRDAGQVWAGQAEARGLGLVLDVERAPPRIVEDEVRLRQIVFNLMSNALKFTDRGDVRLVAEAVVNAGGERLRIAITDSGIGIPPTKLEEIFETFRQVDAGVTRRHGGTGLGLSICRSLARAMGGDVVVASTFGTGSTFTIDLPLERAAPAATAVRLAPAAQAIGEARVLLVEANPISQSVIRSVLAPHVAAASACASAGEAVALLADDACDLLLVDGASVLLRIETALDLAREAAARGTRTVLLWPTPDETVRAAAADGPIALLVAKPVGANDLVAALKSLYEPCAPAEIAA